MNWPNKILFGYCTIASVFLLISGFASYSQSGNPIVLVILLPIIGYFVYYIMRLILKKTPLPTAPMSKNINSIFVIIFIALLTGSLYTIFYSKPIKKIDTKPQWIPGTPTSPTPQVMYGIIHSDDLSQVRVRAESSSESAIISKVKEGDTFQIIGIKEGWTHIQLTASTSGWIKSEFINTTENKNQK